MTAPIVSEGRAPEFADRPVPAVLNAVPLRSRGPAAGMVAGLCGLGVGELASGLLDKASPIVSVGNSVIDHVPGSVKRFAISTFGTNDKQALITGILIITVLYAALVGTLAARRLWWGLAGVAGFGAIGVWAGVTGRTGTGGNAAPVIVAAVVAAAVLYLLMGPAGRSAGRSARPTDGRAAVRLAESMLPTGRVAGLDRRRFVTGSAAAVGVAGVATLWGRSLQRNGKVVAARAKVADAGLPAAADPLPPVAPAATAPVPGMAPFITPNADFYRIDTALAVPRVDPDTWRLKITGLVDHPLTISYKELLARPLVEHDCTLMCVSNEVGGDLVGNARWLGVPLGDLLREAGIRPEATQLVGESVDGWTGGFPTAVALDGRQALVAVAMNGETLPFKHGFPARLVIPGIYGYVSATKWLSEIRLNRLEDEDGYWIPRGWSKLAPIKTQSRIDRIAMQRLDPSAPNALRVGPAFVAGVAWAQHRGIAKVEVRVDDSPWRVANLAALDQVDTWRQWWLPWNATTGRHTISVRATDTSGATQPEQRSDPAPDGATGWHTIGLKVG